MWERQTAKIVSGILKELTRKTIRISSFAIVLFDDRAEVLVFLVLQVL